MEEKERLFLKKAAKILVSLRDSSKKWIVSNLAKANNATYVYTSKIVAKLAKLGLVKSEKKGKVKEVKLTEDGQKIAEALSAVVEKEKPQNKTQNKQQSEQTPPENKSNEKLETNNKKEKATQP
jgi:predicted transcriptional regulator